MRTVTIYLTFVFSLTLSITMYGQSRIDSLLQAIRGKEQFDRKPLLAKYQLELRRQKKQEMEQIASKSFAAMETADDSEGIIFTLQEFGKFYEELRMPAEAIRFLQLAYQKAERTKSTLQMGLTLTEIALVYQNEQMLTESLTYVYQALRIFEEKKFNKKAVIALYEASLINFKASNYVGALNDFNTAYELFKNLPPDSITNDIKFYMMSGWNTVGLANKILKRDGLSIVAFNRADSLAHVLNNKFWMGLIDGNKGELLLRMGRTEEAIALMKEDLRVSLQFDQYSSAALASCGLCEIYTNKKDLNQARRYLDTARAIFRKTRYVSSAARRLLLTTANYYSAAGDYEKAFKALQQHIIVKDSSLDQERLVSLSQIKAQHELEKKQSEIQLLSQRNEIQKEEIKMQRLLIAASALTIVLVVGFLFYAGYSNKSLKRKNAIIESQRLEIEMKNEELEAQSNALQEQNLLVRTNVVELEKRVQERTYDLQLSNLELDTFLYHASHDIRRPIATLLGLERVSRLTDRDSTSKYLFDCVARTAGDMDSMLSKLQMAYHINRPIDDFQWMSLHSIINETVKKFNEAFHQGGIDFSHQQGGQIFGSFSPSLGMIIFSNLIENAIHFNVSRPDKRPFIKITSSQVDNNVVIIVEDNGMGIQHQYLTKIFELYFRGTERSKGNGIGLYLVQKAVGILKGTIEVTSRFEVGTTFRISFPASPMD